MATSFARSRTWMAACAILVSSCLCSSTCWGWWSETKTPRVMSTHDIISKKAFELALPHLRNDFLLQNKEKIMSFTYKGTNDSAAHANAARNGGDISEWWSKFNDNYGNNDDKAAEYLGYCLHLIEDMSVPAHAFNIPHPFFEYDTYANWDAFEAMASFYDIAIDIHGPISEEKAPGGDVAKYYYDKAKSDTISAAKGKFQDKYWVEGEGAAWCGAYGVEGCLDGPAGHYGGNQLIREHYYDTFGVVVPFSDDYDFLKEQLNKSVADTARFLLAVDRVKSSQGPGDDNYEPNNADEDAAFIRVPFYASALQCNDDDWFKVWVQDDERLTVTADFNHSAGDLDLFVFDGSGYQLASSESTLNRESINLSPSTEARYYYIKVTGYNGAKNSYDLHVKTHTTEDADLRVKEFQFKSATVTEGDSTWLDAYVYNSGLSPAGASHASLYFSTNDYFNTVGDYYIGVIPVPPIPALSGAWVRWQLTVPNLWAGNPYGVWAKVVVDDYNEVYEGIEDYSPFLTKGTANFEVFDWVTLTGLTINGPSEVNEKSTATYSATAWWSDGTSSPVALTSWTDNSIYSIISTSGTLSTSSITGNKIVTISASYSYGGVTRVASKEVTILDQTSTLTDLTILGPSELYEDSTAVYVALAKWSNGNVTTVFPAWTESSSFVSMQSDGLLKSYTVSSDHEISITGSYSFAGITKTTTKTIRVRNIPAALTGLNIAGPSSVCENGSFSYSTSAEWSDGSETPVVAKWTLESTAYAAIAGEGTLRTWEVPTDSSVIVSAVYTFGGITKTASKVVRITDGPVTLTRLIINGPASVDEGGYASFCATATWSNGVSTPVAALWSVTSSFASITLAGMVRASMIDNEQSAMITASYSHQGVTMTATKPITVIDASSLYHIRILNDPPLYFPTLQEAYAASIDGDTIQTRSELAQGPIFFDRDISIRIQGGYNADYTSESWQSRIVKTMKISRGTVRVENILIR